MTTDNTAPAEPVPELRDQIAGALMAWAEGNNDPKYAPVRRPETVTKNAYDRADAVLAVVQPVIDEARATNQRLNYRAQAAESRLNAVTIAVANWEINDRGSYIPLRTLNAIAKAVGIHHDTSRWELHYQRVEALEATLARVREVYQRSLPLVKFEFREEPSDEERGWHLALAAVEAALTPPVPADQPEDGTP